MAPGSPAAKPKPVDAATYARVFAEWGEGEAVLEDLTRRFARPAVLEGGIDAVIKTYHRQGSRAVLDFIVAQINRTNGVTDDASPNE